MCTDNLAEASRTYVNHQLKALWKNSKACIKKRGHGVPENEAVKLSIAFREFHAPRQHGKSVFDAVFGKPHIEFLCGHELILRLNVKKCKTHSKSLKPGKLAVLLSYKVKYPDVDEKYEGPSKIGVMAIIPDSARLLKRSLEDDFFKDDSSEEDSPGHDSSDDDSFEADEIVNTEALFNVIKVHYLPLLTGDLLRLFILPASRHKPAIDHAVLMKRGAPEGSDIFGIGIDKIHEIFNRRWLAAVDAHTYSKDRYKKDNSGDTYLADFHDYWDPDTSRTDFWVNIRVHPLKFQVVCPTEVILFVEGDIYMQKDEHHLNNGDESHKPDYYDWKVAIVFEVTKDSEGRIFLKEPIGDHRRIAHDLGTGVDTKKIQNKDDLLLFKCFEKTISTKYIKSIFNNGHNRLYPDLPTLHWCTCREKENCGVIHGPPPPLAEGWKFPVIHNWQGLKEQFVQNTDLHGYHRITTLTQDGINRYFESLWKQTNTNRILKNFKSKEYVNSSAGASVTRFDAPHFETKVESPRVELIVHKGSKSIILYFPLEKIKFFFETKDDEARTYHNWNLAIQFDLEFNKNVSPARLVLNRNSAKYLHARSSFTGLVNTTKPRITRDLYETLGKNFIRRYIHAFFGGALQYVLCELPLHGYESTPGTRAHGYDVPVTKIGFSIVPFHIPAQDVSKGAQRIFQGLMGPDHHIVDRNMIVFHASTGDGAIYAPLLPGPYAAPSDVPPVGTLLLSRDIFLNPRIIKPLYKVNALSGLLCTLQVYNHRKDQWTVKLASWDGHESKLDNEEDCQWEYQEPSLGSKHHQVERVYKWDSKEEWNYNAVGKGTTNATFSITILTNNRLVVPTEAREGGLVIDLSGETTILMHYKAHDSDAEWTGHMGAKWELPISFVPDSDETVKQPQITWVEPDEDKRQGQAQLIQNGSEQALEETMSTFKTVFGKSMESIAGLLKLTIGGVYQGLKMPNTRLVPSDPVFNPNGDLILKLTSDENSGEVKRDASKLQALETTSTSTKVEGKSDKATASKASSPSTSATASGGAVPPFSTVKPPPNALGPLSPSPAPGAALSNGTHPSTNPGSTPSNKFTNGHVQAENPTKEGVDKPSKGADSPLELVGEKAQGSPAHGAAKIAEVNTDKPKASPLDGTGNTGAKAAESTVDKSKTRSTNGSPKTPEVMSDKSKARSVNGTS